LSQDHPPQDIPPRDPGPVSINIPVHSNLGQLHQSMAEPQAIDAGRRDCDRRRQPTVACFFGAYDLEPPELKFVSRWKNLSHARIQEVSRGDVVGTVLSVASRRGWQLPGAMPSSAWGSHESMSGIRRERAV
jgi:hypothetical protein